MCTFENPAHCTKTRSCFKVSIHFFACLLLAMASSMLLLLLLGDNSLTMVDALAFLSE